MGSASMILTNCKELVERSTRGEFENASWLTKIFIRMHLVMCRHCRRYKRQMGLITQTVRSKAARAVDPSQLEDLKKKIIDRLSR